jgi:uncharacterized membrane protein
MRNRAFLAFAILILASFATTGPSWAGFRVCNHSGQRVDVAFGYLHAQFGWTSEGWWTIQPGRCRQVMNGNLTNRFYYLYATGSEGAIWQARPGQKGGFFCVQQDRFVLQNRNFEKGGVLDCASRNLSNKQFFIVNTKGAVNHVHNLSN